MHPVARRQYLSPATPCLRRSCGVDVTVSTHIKGAIRTSNSLLYEAAALTEVLGSTTRLSFRRQVRFRCLRDVSARRTATQALLVKVRPF
jgi:hypothetical protein